MSGFNLLGKYVFVEMWISIKQNALKNCVFYRLEVTKQNSSCCLFGLTSSFQVCAKGSTLEECLEGCATTLKEFV